MKPQSSLVSVLASSLLVPFLARRFGLQLSEEDVSALVGLSLGAVHVVAPYFKRLLDKYLPAPQEETHE